MPGPSPYRLALRPDGQHARLVECPRNIQTLIAAKRYAKDWAGDVGVLGTVNVEKRVGAEWVCTTIARVRNSVIVGWL